jgi:hypothetical protein
MNNDLGVGVSLETVSSGFEFLAKLSKVVDLSVKNNHHRVGFIEQGLFSTLKINDFQPTMS